MEKVYMALPPPICGLIGGRSEGDGLGQRVAPVVQCGSVKPRCEVEGGEEARSSEGCRQVAWPRRVRARTTR
jgi:hypothetical protein